MSDVVAASDSSPLRKNRSRKRWLIALLVGLGIGTTIGYYEQKQIHISTLQGILDKGDETKQLKVVTAKFPIYVSVPFSSYLTEFGLFPASYTSFFTTQPKSGRKQAEGCEYSTYDYTVKQSSPDQIFFHITGVDIVRLERCAA